jgi:hypothetical protein
MYHCRVDVDGIQWPPVIISAAALLFTVAGFWWLNWRRGKLQVAGPQTYAAHVGADKMTLLFPLVFYNTGPTAYVVRDLRLRFLDEPDGQPLDWERVRDGIQPSETPGLQLAAAFPVPGGAAIQMFCEFDRRPPGRTLDARGHQLLLEALTGTGDEWRALLKFTLHVSARDAETMRGSFIAFRNRA